jgi:hypothetical protein
LSSLFAVCFMINQEPDFGTFFTTGGSCIQRISKF